MAFGQDLTTKESEDSPRLFRMQSRQSIVTTPSAEKRLAARTLLGFAVLMLAWSSAWLCKNVLHAQFSWLGSETGSAVFWLTAKLLLWILPACWFVWSSGRRLAEVANPAAWRRWVLWGGVVGIAIAITGIISKAQRGAALLPEGFDYGTMNALVISPLFEEFLIRGALLGNLIPAFGFARANFISAGCFVVLHLPGWFMMGLLASNLSRPVGGALSIFVLGLCFGWATRKGGSFLGGSVAHFLNNLSA